MKKASKKVLKKARENEGLRAKRKLYGFGTLDCDGRQEGKATVKADNWRKRGMGNICFFI